MIKSLSAKNIVVCALVFLAFSSCKKTTSVNKNLPVPDQSFVEEFDTTAAAVSHGWQLINSSDPKGTGVWMDGGAKPPFFKAYSNKGTNAGFIGADYKSTSAEAATISNWLISPSLIMQNGDKIIFYTRSYNQYDGVSDSTDYGNSLQVRLNPTNDQVDVGAGAAVGNFTQKLLNINPNLVWSSVVIPGVIAYPTQWTRFEATVIGVNKLIKSRFAFRYYVTMGGSNGNGTGVGIDSVAYQSVGHQ